MKFFLYPNILKIVVVAAIAVSQLRVERDNSTDTIDYMAKGQ